MPNITYNEDIPDENNNPSVDQPSMKINTNAIPQIWDVDHYQFNTSNGGYHKQVTIPASNIADANNVIKKQAGVASTKDDLYFDNDNGSFLLNSIRAAGVFTAPVTAAPVAVSLSMGFNVSSINKTATTTYEVTLTTNATTGNTVIVLITSTGGGAGWSFTGGVLTITGVGATAGSVISFAVLQV